VSTAEGTLRKLLSDSNGVATAARLPLASRCRWARSSSTRLTPKVPLPSDDELSYAAETGRFLLLLDVDDAEEEEEEEEEEAEAIARTTGVRRYVCSSGKEGRNSGICEQPSGRLECPSTATAERVGAVAGIVVDEVGFAGWQKRTRL
jgi:hypothetical protein